MESPAAPADLPHSILAGIGPDSAAARRPRRLLDHTVSVVGGLLFGATTVIILYGPAVMSRWSASAIGVAGLYVCGAYGIFMAARSRLAHVNLERAYSGHLEELSQRLRTMAYRDSLTGLYNHRYFYEQLSHEVERSLRYGQPLTVLLMDMNNFKDINDTYGHLIGDKFLSLVGQVISRQIRGSDIGARYGGDEFVVILPNTALDEGRATAEKLAVAVRQAALMSPGDEQVKLGLSIGVAVCPDDSRAPGELLQIADRRLYDQKAARKAPRGRPDVA
ncbi:MAG TPA: GGDEF domain-containing protein [Dehalococcoidia bacterium]|nr:GGDEF domain-containing protein [Dehalococcoidia bacterium]